MSIPTLATVPLQPAPALARQPLKIGRFTVRGEIGRGANGVVYAADDPILGREVAIKAILLGDDSAFRHRIEAGFLLEAKSAAKMNHPGIVTIFDAGKTDELAYIAMERLHGRDLHQFIASGQQLTASQAAALMARVSDAVHYAHTKGLVHRDIKPSNILLLDDYKPKVLDFGIALPSRREPLRGHRRQLVGTPNYMSPEQALGRPLDARSDIFSIGTILYELLAGRRAFDASDVDEILAQVISDQPLDLNTLRPGLPPALVEIVRRALAKDVAQRFATALEMRNALAAVALEPAPGAAAELIELEPSDPLQAPLSAQSTARRHAAFFTAIALALVAAAVLFAGDHNPPGAGAPARPAPAVGVISQQSPAPGASSAAAAPGSAAAAAGSTAGAAAPGSASTATTPSVATVAPPAAADAAPRVLTRPASDRAKARAKADAARQSADNAPPPEGSLLLAISPWGEVFVNGASRGISPPLNRISLPPGIYTIEVRNGNVAPLDAQVEIKPGQAIALQHRF